MLSSGSHFLVGVLLAFLAGRGIVVRGSDTLEEASHVIPTQVLDEGFAQAISELQQLRAESVHQDGALQVQNLQLRDDDTKIRKAFAQQQLQFKQLQAASQKLVMQFRETQAKEAALQTENAKLKKENAVLQKENVGLRGRLTKIQQDMSTALGAEEPNNAALPRAPAPVAAAAPPMMPSVEQISAPLPPVPEVQQAPPSVQDLVQNALQAPDSEGPPPAAPEGFATAVAALSGPPPPQKVAPSAPLGNAPAMATQETEQLPPTSPANAQVLPPQTPEVAPLKMAPPTPVLPMVPPVSPPSQKKKQPIARTLVEKLMPKQHAVFASAVAAVPARKKKLALKPVVAAPPPVTAATPVAAAPPVAAMDKDLAKLAEDGGAEEVEPPQSDQQSAPLTEDEKSVSDADDQVLAMARDAGFLPANAVP